MKKLQRPRDKGRLMPGQLIKGSSQPRLTAPSIPCKNKHQIQYKQSPTAFGIATKRFTRGSSLHDSVGPGSYQIQKNPQNPSFSKKGFGAMLSQKERDLSLRYNRGPGPAEYSRTETSFFNKSSKKRAIRFPQAENQGAFWSQIQHKFNEPGPFQYNQMQTARSSNISSSSFKSAIKRWKEKIMESAPNPSTYFPKESFISRRSRGTIIHEDKPLSKKNIIQSLFGKDKQLNGPGEYLIEKSSFKPIKSKSTCGFKFVNQPVANLNKIAAIIPNANYKSFLEESIRGKRKEKDSVMALAKLTF